MNGLYREIAKRYLRGKAYSHLKDYPQLACYAFDQITDSIMLDGRFEAEELEALERFVFPKLPSRKVCLDVGANIGNHSLFFSQHFERVLAFEPHPRTFKLLEANAMLVPNVEPINLGLGEGNGSISAWVDARNMGGASTTLPTYSSPIELQSTNFEIVRLDDLEIVKSVPKIDFIKVDIEKHEAAFLKGASETILRHKPVITIEILPSDHDISALSVLDALGYKHLYMMQSARSGSSNQALEDFFTSASVLLLQKRPSHNYKLVPFKFNPSRTYPVVVCSIEPLE